MEFKVDCLLPQGGHHHLGQEQLRCGDKERGGGSHVRGVGVQSGGLAGASVQTFPVTLSRVSSGFWP